MDLDTDKIDDAVLALLVPTLHDGDRAWKGFAWDVLARLHAKGMIGDPVGKVRSVAFTDEGLARARALLVEWFGKDAAAKAPRKAPQGGRVARPRRASRSGAKRLCPNDACFAPSIDDAIPHEHPVVLPHVSHFMQVPFRTSVKLPHSPQASPS